MPKVNKREAKKEAKKEEAVHPKSRKFHQIERKQARKKDITQKQGLKNAAGDTQAEKLFYFQQCMDDNKLEYSIPEVIKMIADYLKRHDEEIKEIRAAKGKYNRFGRGKESNREDILVALRDTEQSQFAGIGYEAPDLTDRANVKKFRDWDGDPMGMTAIKLKRFKSVYAPSKKSARGSMEE